MVPQENATGNCKANADTSRGTKFDSDLALELHDPGTDDWRMPVVVFMKTLIRYGAVYNVGHAGVGLLTTVAFKQHDCHDLFWPPAPFLNAQLAEAAGVSPSTFRKVRERCIRQGWLLQTQPPNAMTGLYAVAVPDIALRPSGDRQEGMAGK